MAGIVHATMITGPGAAYDGISQMQGRQVSPEEPSDEIVSWCDKLHKELDEGPCLDEAVR